MSTGRQHKQYLARARAMGGSTTVPADAPAKLIRDTHERMSYCAMGRHLGLAHSYLRAIAIGNIKRLSPENAETIAALHKYQPTDASRVSAQGTMRRLQALHALGYSWAHLQREIGCYSLGGIKRVAYGQVPMVVAKHAAAVTETYERLSMRLPIATTPHEKSAIGAARNSARRKGWLPPLAWDDIDTDPIVSTKDTDFGYDFNIPDEVVVTRILNGDMELAASATHAERVMVINRWTGSLSELERQTRWNIHRDLRRSAA